MLIRSASFKCLRAMILTLDPVSSSRRKVPNWTYLVAILTGMFTTLSSVHVNFSSSGRVALVPGLHVLCKNSETQGNKDHCKCCLLTKVACKNVE